MSFRAALFLALAEERGLSLGRPLTVCSVTESTNDDALRAAREGAPAGALFVAGAQTRGRGRRGHAWYAAPGSGLLFSLVLRPKLPVERASALSLVVGLAVRAAVEKHLARAARPHRTPMVKWPNDVLVEGKKICGILVESQVRGAALGAVVVGVGLNLGLGEMPEEVRNRSTSLATLGLDGVEAERVLADVLAELEPRLALFSSRADEPARELSGYDALLGERVKVSGVAGVGAGIDADGKLLVKDDFGRLQKVSAGEVEGLPCDPVGDEA